MKNVMFETMKKLAAVFLVIWNIFVLVPTEVILLPIIIIAMAASDDARFEDLIDCLKETYVGKREAIRRIWTYDHRMADFKYDFWITL